MTRLGFDLGGTKGRAALFAADGAVLAQAESPTPRDYDALLACCGALARQVDPSETAGVGFGVPGRVDPASGQVAAVNLPCLKGRPFRDDLAALLKRPVALANDALCFALAEAQLGAGQGASSVLGMTLGTGVGAGFVLNGKPLRGANGLAAELGHMPFPFREEADGPPFRCNCGQTGCLEATLSGGGLARLALFMTGREVEPPALAARARQGDAEARRVLDRYFTMLAKGLIVVLHSFDPEVIVLGGGLGDLPGLFEAVPRLWGRYGFAEGFATRLLPARHGSLAGALGAALLEKGGA